MCIGFISTVIHNTNCNVLFQIYKYFHFTFFFIFTEIKKEKTRNGKYAHKICTR